MKVVSSEIAEMILLSWRLMGLLVRHTTSLALPYLIGHQLEHTLLLSYSNYNYMTSLQCIYQSRI
jgi:hypothetical protein